MTDQLLTLPVRVRAWERPDPDDEGGPAAGGGAAPRVVRLGERGRPLALAA